MEIVLIAVTMSIEIQTATEEDTAIGTAVTIIRLNAKVVRVIADGNKKEAYKMWIILLIIVIIAAVFIGIKIKNNNDIAKAENERLKEYNNLLASLPEKSNYYIQDLLNAVALSMINRSSMIERGVISVDTMECKYPQYKCRTYGEVYKLQQKALKIKRLRENKNK